MTLHRLLPLVALALNALLIGSALSGARRNARNRAFVALAIAMSVWNLGSFGLRSADDSATALMWERILHVGVVPMPVFFYHYVVAFLGLPRRQPALLAGYAIAAGFLLSVPTSLFMRGVRESAWGYVPAGGPLYPVFFAFFMTYLAIGLVVLVQGYRGMGSSFRRSRAWLVLFGTSVSLLGGLVDFLRFILGWESIYPVGIPANAIFALALGIAIVRYRMLDVRVVAKWAMLYGLIGAVVGVGLFFGRHIVIALEPDERLLLPVVLAAGAAVAIALPFLSRLEGMFERLMFARQHGVLDSLGALAKEMVSVLDLDRLGDRLTHGLVNGIPVLHASLFLRVIGTSRFEPAARAVSEAFEGARPESALDEGLVAWLSLTRKPLCVDDVALRGTGGTSLRGALAALEALGVTLVVPLSIDGELAAILLLGEKVSGEVFQPAEIALLETLMAQTGIALRNSMLYADLQGRMNEIAATQQQLVQSTKLAAIGELAASVAHEINNPLGVILGHADLLARQFAPETKTGKQIAAIQTQGRRAAKIMSDLLNFSRRRDPRREPVALNQLALRASDLLGAKLKKNGVGVETDFDLAAPAVSVDADQITQVLLNVMANACDAQPSGGRLLLRTRFVADVQAVAIDVVDRGVGMTPEQVAQIFEPFYTTKGEQGTGLGLSVSLGIVRNHGGRFEVDSRPGEGTTMTVQLPVNHVPGREVDAAAVKAVAPGTKLLS